MHLNYHFLKFLVPSLTEKFQGQAILACFSQSKDELVLETEVGFIRAHLLPPQVYLAFPDTFHRAKRNSIDLFESVLGEVIADFQMVNFERAFWMRFRSGKRLLFKLHGNRSNILLYQPGDNKPDLLFRNEISEDKQLDSESIEVDLSLNWETFQNLEGNASQFLPTLGKVPRKWLQEQGYPEADLEVKWSLIQELMDMMDSPLFALAEENEEIYLSILPEKKIIKSYSDPILACNELFYLAIVRGNFEKEKAKLHKSLLDQVKKTESYLFKSGQKLQELQDAPPPSQLADVIMAYLHEFEDGKTEATLVDFYSGNPVVVKLKPNQKPQELAESLYRKSKNRQLELDQIQKTIDAKKVFLANTLSKISELAQVTDFRGLKSYLGKYQEDKISTKEQTSLPFKQFEFEGFIIWVGKSAKDNDEMLRGFVHKDDLWLHARQAAGSHVIIRKRGIPTLPKSVLERAGELAAFYSKLKNESLAPVIFTEAKYVRKVKGSPPGSVMVDREQVILVTPKGPDLDTASEKS